MAYAESWHVRSRSRECSATQRPFTDGEMIVTALYPDPESSGYLRRDICLEAWATLPEDAEKPFSFWKTTFSAPSNNESAEDEAKLSPEEILHRLVEEDEESSPCSARCSNCWKTMADCPRLFWKNPPRRQKIHHQKTSGFPEEPASG